MTLYFPELPEEERASLVLKWVPDKPVGSMGEGDPSTTVKPVFSAQYLGDVLNKLGGEQDANEFESLRAAMDEQKRVEFIVSRVGFSRAKAAHYTPKAIKELRPPNSVLTWQSACFCFQGYYPIPQAIRSKAEETSKQSGKGRGKRKVTKRVKTHWTRSRSYKAKRNQLEALTWIVEWLWKTHKQQGGVA